MAIAIEHGDFPQLCSLTRAIEKPPAGKSAQAEPGIQQDHESCLCREHFLFNPQSQQCIPENNMTLIYTNMYVYVSDCFKHGDA